MDVVESLAGMVSSMLEFPLVGFLGRLVPAGGSEAGQQVATAVGTGLDNLGSLCSQAGLDRWELLGLAVLSAITVYRKELSSNSVYNGKGEDTLGGGSGGRGEEGGGGGGGGHQSFVAATTVHLEGCQAVASAGSVQVGSSSASSSGGAGGKPCKCARIAARKQQRAAALRRARASEDERKLKRLVEGRIRSLDLSVNHLQQLRASVDASWSSFSTAWEARRSRGSGVSSASDSAVGGGLGGGLGGGGIGGSASGEQGEARRATGDGFVPPPCSHGCSRGGTPPAAVSEGGTERKERRGLGRGWGREEPQGPTPTPPPRPECAQCAAHSAAHLAATAILRNEDGTVGLKEEDDVWVSSPLGALPTDALNKVLSFLPSPSLLAAAQASSGAREAADGDRVWREAWATRFGGVWESDMCRRAAIRWHLHGWDPRTSAVPQGWKNFFFEFEASWLEWIAAGQNYESSCLVGLHGRLYDLTQFMHRHPGSPETLMDNAGADATEIFEDVGHSFDARGLMKSLDSVAPRAGTTALPATSQAGSTGNGGSSSSGSGGGGGGAGESGGPCILSSTAQRLRKGRALARREGAAARVATAAAAAAAAVAAAAAGARSSRARVPVAAATGSETGGARGVGAIAEVARAAGALAARARTVGARTTVEGAGATAEVSPAQHAAQYAPEEFLCEDCEGAFEPTDLDGDGTAGRDRRRVCLHTCGTMKVFYSPVRAEWAGFYSCCRKHLRFSVAEML